MTSVRSVRSADRALRYAMYCVALVMLALSAPADASSALLPAWQTPVVALFTSFRGPISFGVSLVAIVSAGSTLLWGAEISEFVRRMLMVILVIGAIMFSSNIIYLLFVTSSVIGG